MLADLSEEFTGAEIEAAIEAALYEAFSDNKREITTSDIVKSLNESVFKNVTVCWFPSIPETIAVASTPEVEESIFIFE